MKSPEVEILETRLLFSKGEPHAITAALPRYDHIVIVVEENKSYGDILGDGAGGAPASLWSVVPPPQRAMTPYIQSLAKNGSSFTDFHAEAHPSQPNYLVMLSGSTQGITSSKRPNTPFTAPSLGGELHAAGLTFGGYSEQSRNHWQDFKDIPKADNHSLKDFPKDYATLPTVSMVIFNNSNNMHSNSLQAADDKLKSTLGGYAKWSMTHNSLLIVTWDEGRGSDNHIPTIFYGAHVQAGQYDESVNHLSMLRTIEDMYALAPLGDTSSATSIHDIFI